MKCIFQIIRPLDGFRSEPVACERKEFAEHLMVFKTDNPDLDECFVLVLIDNVGSPEQDVSRAPLYRVDSFIRHFGDNANV